jgi:hypothetical protein
MKLYEDALLGSNQAVMKNLLSLSLNACARALVMLIVDQLFVPA